MVVFEAEFLWYSNDTLVQCGDPYSFSVGNTAEIVCGTGSSTGTQESADVNIYY